MRWLISAMMLTLPVCAHASSEIRAPTSAELATVVNPPPPISAWDNSVPEGHRKLAGCVGFDTRQEVAIGARPAIWVTTMVNRCRFAVSIGGQLGSMQIGGCSRLINFSVVLAAGEAAVRTTTNDRPVCIAVVNHLEIGDPATHVADELRRIRAISREPTAAELAAIAVPVPDNAWAADVPVASRKLAACITSEVKDEQGTSENKSMIYTQITLRNRCEIAIVIALQYGLLQSDGRCVSDTFSSVTLRPKNWMPISLNAVGRECVVAINWIGVGS